MSSLKIQAKKACIMRVSVELILKKHMLYFAAAPYLSWGDQKLSCTLDNRIKERPRDYPPASVLPTDRLLPTL